MNRKIPFWRTLSPGRIPAILPLLALSILGPVACRSSRIFSIESRPPAHPVIVDGRSDDWSGKLYILDDEMISVGFLNDETDLYICLLAENNALRSRIMRGGLTVWLDPMGGKKKLLGIRILPGPASGEAPMPEPEAGVGEAAASEDDPPEGPRSRYEIIDKEHGGDRLFDPKDAGGIEIKAVPSSGLYVCEIKIPLIRSEKYPFAAGAAPGSTINVGFETENPRPREKPRPGEDGARPPMGGGMPGGGGRFGGRMGGMRGGEPPASRDLKIWVMVRTAAGGGLRRAEPTALSH